MQNQHNCKWTRKSLPHISSVWRKTLQVCKSGHLCCASHLPTPITALEGSHEGQYRARSCCIWLSSSSWSSDCRLLQAQPGACRGEEQGVSSMHPWVSYMLHCPQAWRSRRVSLWALISVFFLLDDKNIIKKISGILAAIRHSFLYRVCWITSCTMPGNIVMNVSNFEAIFRAKLSAQPVWAGKFHMNIGFLFLTANLYPLCLNRLASQEAMS